MTFIIILLGFFVGLISLITGMFPIDLIPDSAHASLQAFGGIIARFDVWVPGILPILFQKIDWLIYGMGLLISYDLINRFILSKFGAND